MITDMNVLAQKVHDLPALVNEEAMLCLMRNARLFQGLAQINVHVKSGKLRDSIEVRVLQDTDTIKEVAVVAATEYAAVIEAKYPFMSPAWEQVEPNLKAELEAIQRRIDEHFSS